MLPVTQLVSELWVQVHVHWPEKSPQVPVPSGSVLAFFDSPLCVLHWKYDNEYGAILPERNSKVFDVYMTTQSEKGPCQVLYN